MSGEVLARGADLSAGNREVPTPGGLGVKGLSLCGSQRPWCAEGHLRFPPPSPHQPRAQAPSPVQRCWLMGLRPCAQKL